MEEQTLYKKLKEYGDGDTYPYHMPGHKRKKLTAPLNDIADIDLTEIYDFDNVADPTGIFLDMQNSLAEYLGVQKSYYLVNGSTVGILIAISAAVRKGGKLLLARNAHKSTYHACCIRDIEPVYIYPDIIEGMNIFEAVTPEQVAKVLAEDRVDASEGERTDNTIDAVIIVSPTYEGRIADIKAIADIVHSYGIPLIVDEAHGAHLGFSDGVEGYAQSACKLGADIVIQSLHKTMPSPTQTAVLHVNSELVDINAIEKYLHVYQTSSPSYVLMAAMEASIDYMKEIGKERLKYLKNRFSTLVDDINKTCIYIEALPFEAGVQDPGKLIFSAKKAGLTGKELTDILREEYHLEFEMNVREYVLAMFTVADEDDAYDRLRNALFDIDAKLNELIRSGNMTLMSDNKSKPRPQSLSPQQLNTLQLSTKKPSTMQSNIQQSNINQSNIQQSNIAEYPMSVAWEMNGEFVDLRESSGHCANTFIGLYPPGTPILVPGEKISDTHVADLLNFIECGYEVTGITDGKIKVIN